MSLKEKLDALTDALKSAHRFLDEGKAIGNTYAFISKEEVLKIARERDAAWLNWTCA